MNIEKRGYSIRIYVQEGSPSGIKFVEKSNWTGVGVVCPRPRFNTFKNRPEFNRAGVYLLLGPSDSPDTPIAYIGEADPVRDRLVKHHGSRDFWTMAFVFTNKDSNLNKAHVQWLESRLISLAESGKRCRLENKNRPAAPSLSEADLADVETYLDEMLLCFPVLGISIFEKPTLPLQQKRVFTFNRRDITAQGYESENGFVVIKDSIASALVVESMQNYAKLIREELINSGVLIKVSAEKFRFSQDYEFLSPSTAASVVAGASVNGLDYWICGRQSLKQLRSEQASKG